MKPFEFSYLLLEPFLPVIYRQSRRMLLEICKTYPYRLNILDVGGRKSHYTIGLPANITISDIPKQSELQIMLNLGSTDEIIETVVGRRSNVKDYVLDDMTKSSFTNESFECVSAVEVIEHIEDDARFVQQVQRVLKRGGTFFLTTPNGDYVENHNPDHKRHYSKEQLTGLLKQYFTSINVTYAVWDSSSYRSGLKSWSIRHPLLTSKSMIGNILNGFESDPQRIADSPYRTSHL